MGAEPAGSGAGDGQIVPLSTTLDALEQAGLEVRDVEALREHYGLTLRAWVANLHEAWDDAQELVSPARARAWLLHLAACALAFEQTRDLWVSVTSEAVELDWCRDRSGVESALHPTPRMSGGALKMRPVLSSVTSTERWNTRS